MGKTAAYDYFGFFNDMICCGCRSAEKLLEILSEYDHARLDEYKAEMQEIENEADRLKHGMTAHLMTEFLPPIDREDISTLAHLLDEICDLTEEVLLHLYFDDVYTCRADAICFAEIIVRMCAGLKTCIGDFRNYKKSAGLRQSIIEINDTEEEGDRLYYKAMRTLMTDGTELREVMIWREIYGRLEDCCDAIEKVADAVEEVILKNS